MKILEALKLQTKATPLVPARLGLEPNIDNNHHQAAQEAQLTTLGKKGGNYNCL